jgi:CBS domain-containing protein
MLMQMISEIMTRNVRFVAPQENLQHAAALMDELNVGVLPVCDGDRLIGMITDRDITIRATSAGVSPDTARVQEVMTGDVRWCFEDQSVDEVIQQMADAQIRRVPVVTHHEEHRLIGIVALGDLATEPAAGADAGAVGQVVQEVSQPTAPQAAASADSFAPNEGLADGGSGAAGGSTASGTGSGTGGGTETLSPEDQEALSTAPTDFDAGAPSPSIEQPAAPAQASGGAGNATGMPGGDIAGAGAPDTDGGSRP